MKNYLFTLLLLYVIFNCITIQAQWYQQYSSAYDNLYSILSLDGNTAWIVGRYGVVLKTTNQGTTWISKNSGTGEALSFVYFFDENEGIAAGNYGIIRKTTDGGDNWFSVTSGTSEHFNEGSIVNDSIVYLIGWNGILLKSTDKGSTWVQKTQISSNNYHWVQFFDEYLGWASTQEVGQIWKTTDGGDSWTMKINIGSNSIWQVFFVNDEIGYAVGEWGLILKSTDGGESWIYQSSGTSVNLRSVYFHESNHGCIVGKDERRLWTTNGGNTWILEHTGYNYEYLNVYFYDNNVGWICGTGGLILYTHNGGVPVELIDFSIDVKGSYIILNWRTATELNNSGFEIERKYENQDWEKIGFVPGHGTTTERQAYSFTDKPKNKGKYLYRLKQIDYDGSYKYSDIAYVDNLIPLKFELKQNYPNPFNPSTKILYSIPHTSNMIIKVFDILGNEIETLVNGEEQPGSFEVEFNASTLPSGVYFYRLRAGDFVDTRKMILMK